MLDPHTSQRTSVVHNRFLRARRLARAGRYIENCRWKLSTSTGLKLFNDSFSAGTRSCWLVGEARTRGFKKCTRQGPRGRHSRERACYISSHITGALCSVFLDTSDSKRFSCFLTTYVHFFTPVANANLIFNGRVSSSETYFALKRLHKHFYLFFINFHKKYFTSWLF